jgi:toxin secretion/phage lysis holin
MTWDKIVKTLAAIGGAIAGLFGGFDVMLQVLVGAMIVDYITGWIVAILGNSIKTASGHLDSNIAWKGLLKKGLALLVVLLGAMLDRAVGQQVFRNMVVWFYIANEGLSILENLALAGVPFPSSVKKMLEQMRDKNDKPPDDDHEHEHWPDEE